MTTTTTKFLTLLGAMCRNSFFVFKFAPRRRPWHIAVELENVTTDFDMAKKVKRFTFTTNSFALRLGKNFFSVLSICSMYKDIVFQNFLFVQTFFGSLF